MNKSKKKEWLKKTLFFLIVTLFVALLLSCSFDKPEIPELSVKILKIETDAGTIEERLSVFLMYKDENGRNDYSSIQLVHLESGLTWVLNRENTSFFSSSQLRASDSEKTLWAGSNKIASPFGQIPIGEYSVVLEDLSGNRVIKKLTLKEPEMVSSIPFVFRIQDGRWRIEASENSTFKTFFLILLGADKQPLFVQGLPEGSKLEDSISSLFEKYPDTRYIQCMAQNAQGDTAYLTKYHSLY
jgi:putative lipoprotein